MERTNHHDGTQFVGPDAPESTTRDRSSGNLAPPPEEIMAQSMSDTSNSSDVAADRISSQSSSSSPTQISSSNDSSAATVPTGASISIATQTEQPSQQEASETPNTSLWEGFMASLRGAVSGNRARPQHPSPPETSDTSTHEFAPQRDHVSSPTPSSAPQPNGTNETNTTNTSASHANAGTSESSPSTGAASGSGPSETFVPRPPVLFRLPFNGPDGSPALLAFHPQPLPQTSSPSNATQHNNSNNNNNTDAIPPTQQPPSSRSPEVQPQTHRDPPEYPPGATAHNVHPRSHPHPDGHVPIAPLFVPFGASPLPFAFIYDTMTHTAWPIAQVTPGTPPGGPSPDAPASQQPRLVAGPPFRIILDIHFGPAPEPERPDPERAAKFVKSLERADAELRSRMARLGMGSIGGFGAGTDDQDGLLGCGVCLENYEEDDRPEWIDGQKSQDEAVVAVPCPGHHTLHAGCLRDWLSKTPPSQWTCPFCRANLKVDNESKDSTAKPSLSGRKSATSSTSQPSLTTLRDEVRSRERQRGWRCDAPACLPRYPSKNAGAHEGHKDLPESSEDMTTDLVTLMPCHHEVHLDCLCTSMRVENELVEMDTEEEDAQGEENDDDSDSDGNIDREDDSETGQASGREEKDTVGKWVNCPSCRKECWAELPLRRKPKKAASETTSGAVLEERAEDGKVSQPPVVTTEPQSVREEDDEQTIEILLA